jgi:putative transposase
MGGQVWLTPKPGGRRKSPGPKPRGQPRVEDGRALSGLLYILRNGLRRPEALGVPGPHKTLTPRVVRWSRLGVLARLIRDLAQSGARATHL